ncbi:MAG: hypothetical protein A2901_04235 [Elusimicrobia bacterium RIFCSPLOWO2_01_FULL_54_10]|nr:MAG: hypothetical protein A2901_04235 [Elusimicrobia bacterium RIFCSPLOWO2_01_FULL_54_10]
MGVKRSARPPRVLVVDDDKELRDLVIASLEVVEPAPSFEIEETGHDVEKKVRNFKPDLIVLDLKLPGVHGMKLCEKIKKSKAGKKIKILMLTAYLTPGARDTVMDCGADYCMEKPFGVLELAGTVKKLLGLD